MTFMALFEDLTDVFISPLVTGVIMSRIQLARYMLLLEEGPYFDVILMGVVLKWWLMV
jgi:hypothetical protein